MKRMYHKYITTVNKPHIPAVLKVNQSYLEKVTESTSLVYLRTLVSKTIHVRLAIKTHEATEDKRALIRRASKKLDLCKLA